MYLSSRDMTRTTRTTIRERIIAAKSLVRSSLPRFSRKKADRYQKDKLRSLITVFWNNSNVTSDPWHDMKSEATFPQRKSISNTWQHLNRPGYKTSASSLWTQGLLDQFLLFLPCPDSAWNSSIDRILFLSITLSTRFFDLPRDVRISILKFNYIHLASMGNHKWYDKYRL